MDNELQRTDEWRQDRAGKFTGSIFADLIARHKKTGERLKSFSECVWAVVVERMSGKPTEGPSGFALQWGTDVEPYAREAYELETGSTVVEAGFIQHPTIDYAGCSPDGLIGADGGLEIKSPKSLRIHLERFLDGVPVEYMPQVQGCMWITGRQWWDFVSYHPDAPESHRLLVIRVMRDAKMIAEIESSVLEAETKVQELIETLMRKAA
jgi:hypothetical protein